MLERSDVTALTSLVTQALCKARENGDAGVRHAGIPALDKLPKITTAIFGLGGHDLQPRDMIACYANMEKPDSAPFVYLGTQFFTKDAVAANGGAAGPAEGGLSGNGIHGAADRAEPEPAAAFGVPHPLPLDRRLRHHRVGQAADRHSGRRARPALEIRAEIRLGKERRADQLLHHAVAGAGEDHQCRAGRRRDRDLAGPQGLRAHQSAARAGAGRHLHPADQPVGARSLARPAGEGAQTIRDKKIKFYRDRRLRGGQAPRADRRTRNPDDGHRLHRRGVRPCRPRGRRRVAGRDADQDPSADHARSSAPRAATSSTATWR